MAEIKLNEAYWDCECERDYIHAKSQGNYCPRCNTFAEEQPDSRANEVRKLYAVSKDRSLIKAHKVS